MSGKRASIFGQGRPERPYDEREDEAETPQRATAAQLATRKIKTAKVRRTGGASTTSSINSTFVAPQLQPQQQGGFGGAFGASAPAFGGNNNDSGNSNGMFGGGGAGGGGMFGGSATNSFPPMQSAAPSNIFSNSSFPSFGGTNTNNNQSSGFNPQPPSANFDFTSGTTPSFNAGSNSTPFTAGNNVSFNANTAFGANASMNGNQSAPSFGGGFGGSQAQNNPFSGLSQNTSAQNNQFSGLSQSTTPPGTFGLSQNTISAPGNQFGGLSQSTTALGTFGVSQNNTSASNNQFGGPSQNNTSAPSEMFGGLSQNTSASDNNIFGGPSQNNMFGGASQNNISSAAAFQGTSAFKNTHDHHKSGSDNSDHKALGAAFLAASAAGTTSTPSLFFSASQNNTQPAQNNLFGGNFSQNAQGGGAYQGQTSQQQNAFNSTTTAQNLENTMATASPFPKFDFAAAAQQSRDNATTNSSSYSFGGNNTTSSAPTTGLFNNQPTAGTQTFTPSMFGQQSSQEQSTSQANAPGQQLRAQATAEMELLEQRVTRATAPSGLFSGLMMPSKTAEAPKPVLFGSVSNSEQNAETPQSNPFAKLIKPAPAATSAEINQGMSFLGAAQNKTATSTASEQPSISANGFSTPQPAKTQGAGKLQAGPFTAQTKTSTGTGLFGPNSNFKNTAGNSILKSKPFSTPMAQPPKDTIPQPAATNEQSGSFPKLSTPSAERGNLFVPPEAQAPAASPTMPTLNTGAELPKIAKAHVPKEWSVASPSHDQDTENLFNLISSLTLQLQQLNNKYRTKLMGLSPTADWSSLSLWHHQHSSAIKTKIDIAKKQRAAANGVTGTESSLSTKRKVNDDEPDTQHASPSKRARPAEVPASPTPPPSAPTPKANPPATATSSLFAKAIKSKPDDAPAQNNVLSPKPTTSTQNNMFAPKPATQFPKGADAVPGFKPFSGVTDAFSAPKQSSTGFKPNTSTSNAIGGFKPTIARDTSTGFAAQFAQSAKTYEQLAAERKKKAMDEDYDSDDETKEEWSARYDKEEAERIAKEKEKAAEVKGFSTPASAASSGTSTPVPNPFAKLAKPPTGTLTPGLLNSRAASPALSIGSQSVFNVGSAAQTPSSNIFGHLSSGASSNNQDDSDEDAAEQTAEASQNEQSTGSVDSANSKRKFGASETEADDSQDDTSLYKKQDTTKKGSLLSRMTRDDGSESEKENTDSGSVFGKLNGTQTPTNKHFFDFTAAGAKTAPPKSDTFAGDQTFKHGTPIKFGGGAETEKKAGGAPIFNFQPASTSTTPSKAPPINLFNAGGSSLLAPANPFANLNSAPSSAFSSRAATPLSEAETTAQSGNEDDEDDKLEQVDLSKLTAEEQSAFDVVFETELALAKHHVDKTGDGNKSWENFARGPLYILKDKVTGKCFVRIKLANGTAPLNYSILPGLKASVAGNSGRMVAASMPKKNNNGIAQYFISLKTKEVAEELAEKYNASLPSQPA